ncbi:hypothetical protein T4C_12614 [Trichinella pseudospiralis]|uniref:Transmembrane protein n=1 Tax=Trichinella pseudospiralis TaxID=6337 RepID=A0A0V1K4C9_TRIPS|nr:hypothetical protein T4C_12614 [Trichinella pseudospiralis]
MLTMRVVRLFEKLWTKLWSSGRSESAIHCCDLNCREQYRPWCSVWLFSIPILPNLLAHSFQRLLLAGYQINTGPHRLLIFNLDEKGKRKNKLHGNQPAGYDCPHCILTGNGMIALIKLTSACGSRFFCSFLLDSTVNGSTAELLSCRLESHPVSNFYSAFFLHLMNTLNEISPPTLQRLKISALCRISLSGSLLLAAGVAMSIVGYYSRQEASVFAASDPLVPLSYLGPVVMGAGAFILIIVCVVTLESRDKNESKNSNWKNISSKFRLSSSEQSNTNNNNNDNNNNNNNNNNTPNKSVQLETAQSQSVDNPFRRGWHSRLRELGRCFTKHESC